MATRIRKLAKKLRRTPAEILGYLHALGYTRYRSPEDMVSDVVIERLNRGIRDGVRPIPVGSSPPARPAPLRPQQSSDENVMSQLVPGIVRTYAGGPKGRGGYPRPLEPPPPPADESIEESIELTTDLLASPAVAGNRGVQAAKAALDAERKQVEKIRLRLAQEQERLRQERAALQQEQAAWQSTQEDLRQERSSLEALRRALEIERSNLDVGRSTLADQQSTLEEERAKVQTEREQLSAQILPEGAVPLVDVMRERGLRGLDESERALAALAQGRHLHDLLPSLIVLNGEAARSLLNRRLLLVGGEVPSFLPSSTAAVSVAPDRSELPNGARLVKDMAQLSELTLLNGMRRVLVVGGRPMWHRTIREAVDRRVELRFEPSRTRTRVEAEKDVLRTDLLILWNTPADETAHAVYRTSRALLVEVNDSGLPTFVQTVLAALSQDA